MRVARRGQRGCPVPTTAEWMALRASSLAGVRSEPCSGLLPTCVASSPRRRWRRMMPSPSQISAPRVADKRTTNHSGHVNSQKKSWSVTSSVFCTMKMTSRAPPVNATMAPPLDLTLALASVVTGGGVFGPTASGSVIGASSHEWVAGPWIQRRRTLLTDSTPRVD